MPPEDREYVEGIKAAAEEAGHEHILWDAAALAEKHLLSRLPLNAEHFEERLVAMIRGGGIVQDGVGPGWMRKVLPF